jgi:hypothetical protein
MSVNFRKRERKEKKEKLGRDVYSQTDEQNSKLQRYEVQVDVLKNRPKLPTSNHCLWKILFHLLYSSLESLSLLVGIDVDEITESGQEEDNLPSNTWIRRKRS